MVGLNESVLILVGEPEHHLSVVLSQLVQFDFDSVSLLVALLVTALKQENLLSFAIFTGIEFFESGVHSLLHSSDDFLLFLQLGNHSSQFGVGFLVVLVLVLDLDLSFLHDIHFGDQLIINGLNLGYFLFALSLDLFNLTFQSDSLVLDLGHFVVQTYVALLALTQKSVDLY